MNPTHNLKFVEAAILKLRSEITSDVAVLEALLKDPTAATTNEDIVEDICRLAHRCVATDAAAAFLQKSLPAQTPQRPPVPPTPPIKGDDLIKRSPTLRRQTGDEPPISKKKKK